MIDEQKVYILRNRKNEENLIELLRPMRQYQENTKIFVMGVLEEGSEKQ